MESISWELALKPDILQHNNITFTQVENISWELALKPGYHNTIVPYIINTRPGNNGLSQKALSPVVCLARGKHPLPPKGTLARGMSRPGNTPTSGSPEVLCPRGTQGFGNASHFELTAGITAVTQGWRRSPAVACWASDHWVASSNPLWGKFRH